MRGSCQAESRTRAVSHGIGEGREILSPAPDRMSCEMARLNHVGSEAGGTITGDDANAGLRNALESRPLIL